MKRKCTSGWMVSFTFWSFNLQFQLKTEPQQTFFEMGRQLLLRSAISLYHIHPKLTTNHNYIYSNAYANAIIKYRKISLTSKMWAPTWTLTNISSGIKNKKKTTYWRQFMPPSSYFQLLNSVLVLQSLEIGYMEIFSSSCSRIEFEYFYK